MTNYSPTFKIHDVNDDFKGTLGDASLAKKDQIPD